MSALTRRGLVGGALAAAAARAALAAAPAGALAALAAPAGARAADEEDAMPAAALEPRTVRGLIHREDAAAAAYRLAGGALFARLAGASAQRATALRVQLESMTITAGPPVEHAEREDPLAARLAAARGRAARLDAAIALESGLRQACVDAARTLAEPGLLQTLATIAGAHAQQFAVLRARAGRPPLDEATLSDG